VGEFCDFMLEGPGISARSRHRLPSDSVRIAVYELTIENQSKLPIEKVFRMSCRLKPNEHAPMAPCVHYLWRENSISHVELECDRAGNIAGDLV
jgi:hypothetical protein